LGATLALPCREGISIAALLVPGSGPVDRDETVGDRKPLRDLARALASAGIATLRFDKRTYARPDLVDAKAITVESEVLEDAVTALAALRSHVALRNARFVIIGHSLGALLAPDIAERAGRIAGLVLLSPPGRPLSSLVVAQLRKAGSPQASAAELQNKRILDGAMPDNEVFFGAPAIYYRDLERRDELHRAVRLALPVLLLRGSMDAQVEEQDFAVWSNALRRIPGFESHVVEGLDHFFGDAGGRFSASAAALIVDFLSRLQPAASAMAARNPLGSSGER
jgi:hypothetical protein